MKIDIKKVLDDKESKGDRWLADAVEAESTEAIDVEETEEKPCEEESVIEAETEVETEVETEPETEPEAPEVTEPEEAAADIEATEPKKEEVTLEENVEMLAIEEAKEKDSVSIEESASKPLEEKKTFFKQYGSIAIIIAIFALLMASTFAYTNLVPREVHATINGKEYNTLTKAHTVEKFLSENNIKYCEEDYLSLPVTAFIYDGISFKLKHATDFTVKADGKTKKYKTLKRTVGEALKDCGVKVAAVDIITPTADTMIGDNMAITIQRVTTKTVTVEEKVPFGTKERDDSTINEGTQKVVREGADGLDKVTYEITYVDGKESSKREISRTTITAVVDKVIANGTRINFNGKTYSKKLVVKAYAYTGGGRTAMGTRARVGEIAVDPKVIPLGKKVYIEGVGPRRAEDTGGNIKGNTIDIYMDSQKACRKWGVRYVTIYIE